MTDDDPLDEMNLHARSIVGLRVAFAHRLNPVAFINGAPNILTVT
jgi:hypothetical protein